VQVFYRRREATDEDDKVMAKDHGSSIKDDEQYERLREQGESKQKAARIANTGRSTAGKRGGKEPRYEDWSKEDLQERAREIGIEGRSKMNKGELIKALRNH
jgi:Rho termination factor, N-terminal domain